MIALAFFAGPLDENASMSDLFMLDSSGRSLKLALASSLLKGVATSSPEEATYKKIIEIGEQHCKQNRLITIYLKEIKKKTINLLICKEFFLKLRKHI